jgi:hypothetical protein
MVVIHRFPGLSVVAPDQARHPHRLCPGWPVLTAMADVRFSRSAINPDNAARSRVLMVLLNASATTTAAVGPEGTVTIRTPRPDNTTHCVRNRRLSGASERRRALFWCTTCVTVATPSWSLRPEQQHARRRGDHHALRRRARPSSGRELSLANRGGIDPARLDGGWLFLTEICPQRCTSAFRC